MNYFIRIFIFELVCSYKILYMWIKQIENNKACMIKISNSNNSIIHINSVKITGNMNTVNASNNKNDSCYIMKFF